MVRIEDKIIEEAVYNLCVRANTEYPKALLDNLCDKYHACQNSEDKLKLQNILNNINAANKTKRPLCQDTGQVIVFVQIGQKVQVDSDINFLINNAVKKAYTENFYRKSVVKNAIFNRENTDTNTPAIVYTETNDSDEIKFQILIKGAGSENYSSVKMFKPTARKEEIFEYIKNSISEAGEKACPPYVLGIGAGGTMEQAALLSKKAFFVENFSTDEQKFITDLKNFIGDDKNILDVKIKTSPTHIACLPVALTINCHSCRHAQCIISKNEINYLDKNIVTEEIQSTQGDFAEIHTDEIEKIKQLAPNQTFLLSGEIYTARDAAHERILKYFDKHRELPFDLKNKIIFYAGPCPAAENEAIGPIGPTTSARMDKFCDFMYKNGIIATIGKGERSVEAIDAIKNYGGKYFTVQGGIACLLSKCVTEASIVAFDDLGTEAVRKLKIKNMPVRVEI